jgi:CMP-2-keto-3-deoxyoctulosonic acid synthetase
MSIENVLRPGNSKYIEINQLKQSAEKTAGKNAETIIQNGEGGDRLSISQEARDLHHTDLLVREELGRLPDIREEKVKEVIDRIKNNSYDNVEIIAKTADAILLQSSQANRIVAEPVIKKLFASSVQMPEIRQEQIDKAKERKEGEFYNQEEPIRKASDNLWIPPLQRK